MTHSPQNTAGVRVIEFAGSGIAAAYAGWSLARMGANVTRLISAASLGDTSPATADDPIGMTLEVLRDGKSCMPCPADATTLGALLSECDILITDDRDAFEAWAGPLDDLMQRFPRLVTGVASVFGLDGPYAGYRGVSLDAQALSAVSWSMGDPAREPLSFAPGVIEHQGGVMLAAGCLLALGVREESGQGRVVDISLAEIMATYVAGNCRLYIHHNLQWHRSGRRASESGGAYPYVTLPCKDGQVCISGRTREEWMRFV